MAFKRLFEIQLFHHYFLDHGQDAFDQQDPFAHNSSYQSSKFIELIPLYKTALFLKNHRWLLKSTPLGLTVLSKTEDVPAGRFILKQPIITPSPKDKIVFAIRVTDPFFYNYSNVIELNDLRLYHFSNSPSVGLNNIFDNSGVNDFDNNFLLSEAASRDLLESLTRLESGLSSHDLENALDFIEKDTSVSDIPQAKQDLLSQEVKRRRRQGILGYVVIDLSNNTAGERLLEHNVNGPKYIEGDGHIFKFVFKSKEAFWKYHILKGGKTYELETQAKKQFYLNGYTEIDAETDLDASNQLPQNDANAPTVSQLNSFNFPSASPESLRLEGNKTYSDVYITI